jgi:putative tricarboxylic transport membrane protein
MRVNDAILGALFLAFGGALIATAQTFPPMHGQPYGASTFPTVVGAGFVVLSLFLILSGIGSWRETAGVTLSEWGRSPAAWLRLALIVALVLAYIVFSKDLGFLIAGAAVLFGMLLTFRTGPLIALAVAVAAVLVVQQVFGGLLRVPLPRGLLTEWL